jgi:hypothetical protein
MWDEGLVLLKKNIVEIVKNQLSGQLNLELINIQLNVFSNRMKQESEVVEDPIP